MPCLPIAITSRPSEAPGQRSGISGCQNRGGWWRTHRITSCMGNISILSLAGGSWRYGCRLLPEAQDEGERMVAPGSSDVTANAWVGALHDVAGAKIPMHDQLRGRPACSSRLRSGRSPVARSDKNYSTTRVLIFRCVGNVRSSLQLPLVRAQRDASAFEAQSPACGRAR